MKEKLQKLIKFGITGVMNTLVDFLVFTLLAQVLSVNLYLSQVCGYSAGILNSYIINRKWTFRTKNKFFSTEFLRFLLINGIMLCVSLLLLYVFNDLLGIGDLVIFGHAVGKLVAKLMATGITMLISFFANHFLVFQNT